MKRLTLIILGVLLCTPLYSDMNTYVIGSGGGSSVCSGNYGHTTQETVAYKTAGRIYLNRYPLGCSGSNPDFNAYLQYITTGAYEVILWQKV